MGNDERDREMSCGVHMRSKDRKTFAASTAQSTGVRSIGYTTLLVSHYAYLLAWFWPS